MLQSLVVVAVFPLMELVLLAVMVEIRLLMDLYHLVAVVVVSTPALMVLLVDLVAAAVAQTQLQLLVVLEHLDKDLLVELEVV